MVQSPQGAVSAARDLCRRPETELGGCWPRSAALLARQALEHGLDEYWMSRKPEVVPVRSQHAKLLCLPTYLDPTTARAAAHLWAELSRACHQHAYDLPPTVEEVDSWLDEVERVLLAVQRVETV